MGVVSRYLVGGGAAQRRPRPGRRAAPGPDCHAPQLDTEVYGQLVRNARLGLKQRSFQNQACTGDRQEFEPTGLNKRLTELNFESELLPNWCRLFSIQSFK